MGWLSDLVDWHVDLAGGIGKGVSEFFTGSETRKQSKEQFNQVMNESIQRRVADARQAGVHPLFALGANVGATPTTTFSGGGGSVSNIADAYGMVRRSKRDPRADALLDAQIGAQEAQASRDTADAMLLDAQRYKLFQDMVSQGRDTVSPVPPETVAKFGAHEIVPKEVTASRPKNPGLEAGPPVPSELEATDSKGVTRTYFGMGVPGLEEVNTIKGLRDWMIDYLYDMFSGGRRFTERELYEMELRMDKKRRELQKERAKE